MSKHLITEDISRYVTNKMSLEEETSLQEHISECEECARKVKEFRALHYAFISEETVSRTKRIWLTIYHNPFVRIAAVLAIVAGVGFAVYSSRPQKGNTINAGNEAPAYLSADSLSRDSIPDIDSIRYTPQE